jgi:hypothetical protein
MNDISSNDISYQGRSIKLVTQQFGNGTAVEVSVDGKVVLDRYDARALYVSEAEALRQGAQFGRDHIDGRPFAGAEPANAEEAGTTVDSWNPGEHGTGRG